MQLLPLLQTDLPLLPDLQPADWSDITPYYSFYLAADFCFPVKICVGASIAGIGAAIIHNNVAWLGHIIVHSDHRNKGIGGIITRGLVDLAEEKKCKTVLLIATDLGAPVYEKAGFVTETNYLFYKDLKPEPNWKIPDTIFPYTDKFSSQVAALDKLISGEDRLFHLQQHFADSCVFLQDNKVEGIYLPTFGDGAILARTPEAGIELMKLRLQKKDTGSIPADNAAAINFLSGYSYQPFKQAKRMRLGEAKKWLPQCVYNRIGGNLG